MSFGTAPKPEAHQDNEEEIKSTQEPIPTKTENLTYEQAQEQLSLKVETANGDRNTIFVHGSQENLKLIFRTLLDKLGYRQLDHEVESNWKDLQNGEELRPGGTYVVAIMNRDNQTRMLIQNRNARDYEPINKPMHEAVEISIMKTAKEQAIQDKA